MRVEKTKKDAPARKRPNCLRDRGEARGLLDDAAVAEEDREAGDDVGDGAVASGEPRCSIAIMESRKLEASNLGNSSRMVKVVKELGACCKG